MPLDLTDINFVHFDYALDPNQPFINFVELSLNIRYFSNILQYGLKLIRQNLAQDFAPFTVAQTLHMTIINPPA